MFRFMPCLGSQAKEMTEFLSQRVCDGNGQHLAYPSLPGVYNPSSRTHQEQRLTWGLLAKEQNWT